MALETANYISGLVSTNPTSTDTVSQADDHIRLIKKVLKDTFPNINAPVTATPAQLNSAVPTGFIGMWSGSLATIPTGWALCDGSGGRPDLRDRFIVGAGSTYSIGATGGANSVSLTEANIPSHTHSFSGSGSSSEAGSHSHTINDPGHTHSYQSQTTPFIAGTGGSYSLSATTSSTGSATTGISINSAGAHTHSITVTGVVGSTGSGTAHENRPPYFALAFIIKL
jgi:microcystin-dependent protein